MFLPFFIILQSDMKNIIRRNLLEKIWNEQKSENLNRAVQKIEWKWLDMGSAAILSPGSVTYLSSSRTLQG